MGADPEAQIDYGTSPGELSMYRDQVAARIAPFSVRQLAGRARVSVGTVSNLGRRAGKQSRQTLVALDRAAAELEAEAGT